MKQKTAFQVQQVFSNAQKQIRRQMLQERLLAYLKMQLYTSAESCDSGRKDRR